MLSDECLDQMTHLLQNTELNASYVIIWLM